MSIWFFYTHFCCKTATSKPPLCITFLVCSSMGSCASSWSPWLEIYLWLEPSLCFSFAGRWVPWHWWKDVSKQFSFTWRDHTLMRFSSPFGRNWTSTGLDWLISWISLVWGEFMCLKELILFLLAAYYFQFVILVILLSWKCPPGYFLWRNSCVDLRGCVLSVSRRYFFYSRQQILPKVQLLDRADRQHKSISWVTLSCRVVLTKCDCTI